MLLKLENISKGYGNPGTDTWQPVLDNISLQIAEGESIAITGPSGSGKTTLLNIIGSLDKPDEGKVSYREREITGFHGNELAEFRNREVGFVFQMHHLLPQCTLLENVLIPTLPNRKDPMAVGRAEKLLDRVGLLAHEDKKPGLLSGGECQRAAVVRALINNPGLLLADEPTGSLDHENAVRLIDLLLEIHRDEKLTLLVVTHAGEIAEKMNKVFRLRDGKLEINKSS